MNHIGLFEGVGGFSLAASWMNWDTIAWCEINERCQKILRKKFPRSKEHYDIKKTDFTIYKGQCDVLTGGFPCQPYSVAGSRKGKSDSRHLWPEMLRAIREIEPNYVVGENVYGLINWNGGMVFDEICADLEKENYEVWPIVLPALSVGAFHKRNRIWFIGIKKNTQHTNADRLRPYREEIHKQGGVEFQHEQISLPGPLVSEGVRNGSDARIFRDANGISDRVDRIIEIGNAISPQIALQIFKTIQAYDNL